MEEKKCNCGGELIGRVLASCPPQYIQVCEDCGKKQYVLDSGIIESGWESLKDPELNHTIIHSYHDA